MKYLIFRKCFVMFFVVLSFIACEKNYTVFIEDEDAEDLSVFSDKGNNTMSCYINGNPFRTRNRVERYGFGVKLDSEINLYKDTSAVDSDTLIVIWQNADNAPLPRSVSLVLAMPKGFSYTDFGSLNGKRLAIDGVNGYFMADGNLAEKGVGNIYFHRALLIPNDSLGTNSPFSGVFEATLPSYKITRGRFDHFLATGLIFF